MTEERKARKRNSSSQPAQRDLHEYKKDLQEFKTAEDEQDKLKKDFHKKELVYISIIIALSAIIVGFITKLVFDIFW